MGEIRRSFLLVYGSQTGESEAIARDLCRRSEEAAFAPKLVCADKFNQEFHLESEPLVVIVISSTGDGDPPDNALKFYRYLLRKDLPTDHLRNTKFALLGLGDSNYSTFLGVPKRVEKRLLQLGAVCFHPSGFCDEAVGTEEVAEPWMESVVKAIGETSISAVESRVPADEPPPPTTVHVAAAHVAQRLSVERSPADTGSVGQRACACELDVSSTNDCFVQAEEDEEDEPCACDWGSGVSLKRGAADLAADPALRVPVLSAPFLSVAFAFEKQDVSTAAWQNGCPMPGACSQPHSAPVVGLRLLTTAAAKKPKIEVTVDLREVDVCCSYEPGDAFYFAFNNHPLEVDYIIRRLRLTALADNRCTVALRSDTKRANAAVPPHLTQPSTLRHLLSTCVDMRRTPGRPLLRVLADCASDERDKRRLLELCSSQGLHEFTGLVRKAGVSLADLLHAFPSCLPPLERLLELLPRLQPRPFSVAGGGTAKFVFSLLKTEKGGGRFYERFGLCTNFLRRVRIGDHIGVMLKEPSRFRLTGFDLLNTPLILIGPGTGVAPFMGFLEHLSHLDSTPNRCANLQRWLFFGYRTAGVDDIYRAELEAFERRGTLSRLLLCESRPAGEARRGEYVQDALRQNGAETARLLTTAGDCDGLRARVFVCGDARGMSRDVFLTFVRLLCQFADMTEVEATNFLVNMKDDGCYVEDVWS